ncbi:MAG TPA: chloride channel protein [Solirubrobacteraceae bacterium]|nr:chloride channel protein [Solirubrobacteraceae bacterium]
MSGADLDQNRWSSPQGNVTGLGIVASYSVRFWTLVIGLGVITGLAATMQAPLGATVLVLEMTNHFEALMVPTLVTVVAATVVSRRLGGGSIYSARLRTGGVLEPSPSADAASEAAIHSLDEDPRGDCRPPSADGT